MEQNAKPGLYTRMLRFFLRDLYGRTDALQNRAEQAEQTAQQLRGELDAVKLSAQAECTAREQLGEELRQCLTDSTAGQAERTQRSELRLDALEHYRRETEKRMESDDMTTIGLSHRMEVAENALREGGLLQDGLQLFNKKTYSQAGEDAIIMYAAAMLGIPLSQCNYLDLGANRPREMSNTCFFYEQGARGVLVEANCSLIPALEAERPGDTVLNMAITDKSGGTVTFNVLNLDGLSRIGDVEEILRENPDARLERSAEIGTISVNDIIAQYFGGKAPVILNLDIEGLERQILDSIDFERYRPLFMIIEMIPYSRTLTAGIKDEALLACARSKGYIEYAFTGINSIFIDERRYRALTGKEDA